MNRLLAALLVAGAASFGVGAASAQDAAPDAVEELTTKEIPQERMDLALKLVKLTGTSRTFDELLPNIADQAKNAFIRANPQMQLGIIDVVDRVALTLVSRRPELDQQLARVWASGFDEAELQQLIDFYSSDIGKKFADLHPKLLAVEMTAADRWGRSISAELTEKVSEELRAAMAAEQNALQGDTAGPEAPAPVQ
jgi:hypothetical protein